MFSRNKAAIAMGHNVPMTFSESETVTLGLALLVLLASLLLGVLLVAALYCLLIR